MDSRSANRTTWRAAIYCGAQYWAVSAPWHDQLLGQNDAAKVAVTLAVIGAVVGEFVRSVDGLGNLLLSANSQLDGPLAWAALIWLSVLGPEFAKRNRRRRPAGCGFGRAFGEDPVGRAAPAPAVAASCAPIARAPSFAAPSFVPNRNLRKRNRRQRSSRSAATAPPRRHTYRMKFSVHTGNVYNDGMENETTVARRGT